MKSYKYTIIIILFLNLFIPWARGNTPLTIIYDFKTQDDLNKWTATKSVDAIVTTNGVVLRAKKWDAKIFRGVTLNPGSYVLSGCASGSIEIFIFKDFSSPILTHLDLSSKTPFTDYVDFTIPSGSAESLIISASVLGSNNDANLQWLKIENPPVEAVAKADYVPTPEELEKYCPNPPIVRGFMWNRDGSEKYFKDMSLWGANVVRLQLNPVGMAKPFNLPFWDAWPKVLDEIEQTVKNANKYGIHVVIDLHAPPMPNIMDGKDLSDQPELWHDPQLDASFLRFWTDVAKRLKPYGNGIWGYDLLNEPLDRSQLPWAPKQWRPLAVKLLKAIRVIDRNVWIIYEPGPGSLDRGFDGLIPLPDTHVIYSVHSYAPGEFTGQGLVFIGGFDRTDISKQMGIHYPSMINGVYFDKFQIRKSLAPAIDFANKWHTPMYVGEFSVIRWAPKDDAVRWLQDSTELFEELGWSWTYHAFREFNGWSLELDESYWRPGMPVPQPVNFVTERGKVIRKALEANKAEIDVMDRH
jgi:endoglucanase